MHKTLMIVASMITFFVSESSMALFNPFTYLNYLQDLDTALQSAKQVQQQLTAVKYQAQNSGIVSNYQWRSTAQLLEKMNRSSQQGQAISSSMSDLDAQFRQKYPDYSNRSSGQIHYSQAYKKWNATTLDTLRSTLDTSAVSVRNHQKEAEVIQQLKRQGQSATGRMQVLQVSSELAAENVNQLQELKRIMVAQGNAQNAYMAYRVSKDSYHEKEMEAINANMDTHFPTYHNNPHFGEIPSML